MKPILIQRSATPIVLADLTDHNPAAINNLGTRTHQIDLTSLAAGAYRQSAKFDLGVGSTDYHPLWECTAAIEPVSAPTAGGLISLFLGFSDAELAGSGNPCFLTGADGAYTAYGAAATDADEMTAQFVPLGSRPFSADDDIQVMHFGVFVPRARFAILVIKNGLSVDLEGDAVEMSIRLKPILQGVQ